MKIISKYDDFAHGQGFRIFMFRKNVGFFWRNRLPSPEPSSPSVYMKRHNTWHYLFEHQSYFVEETSCLSNIAWKTKVAVDLHTKGSMLLKRNKTFALISNSLKILYLPVI